MGKVSYSKFNLKPDTSVNTFTFNDTPIEVTKHMGIDEKYDLLMITLQKSAESDGSYYNPLKLEMFFHLHLVYLYTNLSFTDKQREKEPELYDCLKQSGFIDSLIETMEEDEYKDLWAMLIEIKEEIMAGKASIANIAQILANIIPDVLEKTLTNLDSFSPEKYQQVLALAKATGFNPAAPNT